MKCNLKKISTQLSSVSSAVDRGPARSQQQAKGTATLAADLERLQRLILNRPELKSALIKKRTNPPADIATLVNTFFYRISICKETGCWIFGGQKSQRYSHLDFRYRRISGHHMAWMMYYGDIPRGLHVLHKCDRTKCCNPAHLFLGTQKDNVQDSVRKGRCIRAKGSQNGHAILTESQVSEIKRIWMPRVVTRKMISRKFNISIGCLDKILYNQSWKHVV